MPRKPEKERPGRLGLVARKRLFMESSADSASAAARKEDRQDYPYPLRDCPATISDLLDEARRRKVASTRFELCGAKEMSGREMIAREYLSLAQLLVFTGVVVDEPSERDHARLRWLLRVQYELNALPLIEEKTRAALSDLCISSHLLSSEHHLVSSEIVEQEEEGRAHLQAYLDALNAQVYTAAARVSCWMYANLLFNVSKKMKCAKTLAANQLWLNTIVSRNWFAYKMRKYGRQQREIWRGAFTREAAIVAEEDLLRLEARSDEVLDTAAIRFCQEFSRAKKVIVSDSHSLLLDTKTALLHVALFDSASIYANETITLKEEMSGTLLTNREMDLFTRTEQFHRRRIHLDWKRNPLNSVAAMTAAYKILVFMNLSQKRRQRRRRIEAVEKREKEVSAATDIQRIWRARYAKLRTDRLRLFAQESAERFSVGSSSLVSASSLMTGWLELGFRCGSSQLQLLNEDKLESRARFDIEQLQASDFFVLSMEKCGEDGLLEAIEAKSDLTRTINAERIAAVFRGFLSRRRLRTESILTSIESVQRDKVTSEEGITRGEFTDRMDVEFEERVAAQHDEATFLALRVVSELSRQERAARESAEADFKSTLDDMQMRMDAGLACLQSTGRGLLSRKVISAVISLGKSQLTSRLAVESSEFVELEETVRSNVADEEFTQLLGIKRALWRVIDADVSMAIAKLVQQEEDERSMMMSAQLRFADVLDLEMGTFHQVASSPPPQPRRVRKLSLTPTNAARQTTSPMSSMGNETEHSYIDESVSEDDPFILLQAVEFDERRNIFALTQSEYTRIRGLYVLARQQLKLAEEHDEEEDEFDYDDDSESLGRNSTSEGSTSTTRLVQRIDDLIFAEEVTRGLLAVSLRSEYIFINVEYKECIARNTIQSRFDAEMEQILLSSTQREGIANLALEEELGRFAIDQELTSCTAYSNILLQLEMIDELRRQEDATVTTASDRDSNASAAQEEGEEDEGSDESSEDLLMDLEAAQFEARNAILRECAISRNVTLLLHEEAAERFSIGVEYESSTSYSNILMMHDTIAAMLDDEELDDFDESGFDSSRVAEQFIAEYAQVAGGLLVASAENLLGFAMQEEGALRASVLQARLAEIKTDFVEFKRVEDTLRVPSPVVQAVRALPTNHRRAQSLLLAEFNAELLASCESQEQARRRMMILERNSAVKALFLLLKEGGMRIRIRREALHVLDAIAIAARGVQAHANADEEDEDEEESDSPASPSGDSLDLAQNVRWV